MALRSTEPTIICTSTLPEPRISQVTRIHRFILIQENPLNPTLRIAVVIVTGALLAYSIAVITEQRKKFITPFILAALTTGITLDISSTVLMIIGSRHIPITIHGCLGYSALAVMLVDTILLWRFWNKGGRDKPTPRKLHLYTRFCYIWWAIAYVAGAALAMHGMKR